MDVQALIQNVLPILLYFVLRVLGALALWIIGRRLIQFAVILLVRTLKYPFDQTVAAYIGTTVKVLLNIVLIVAILGFFGVETTSFAALMAGVGLAIGAAWSGLLANLAAGIFLLILRPFKVGDFIGAAGVTGTVEEIGLFVTTVNTLDNVRTFVGNNKLFSDNIQNFSGNPYRRVDLVAQLAQQRGYRGGHAAAPGAPRPDSQRQGRAEAGRGDSHLHAPRAGAGGASVL